MLREAFAKGTYAALHGPGGLRQRLEARLGEDGARCAWEEFTERHVFVRLRWTGFHQRMFIMRRRNDADG